MNRKDFELIEQVFRDVEKRSNRGTFDAETLRRFLAMRLADALGGHRDCGGFRRDEFLKACKAPHEAAHLAILHAAVDLK